MAGALGGLRGGILSLVLLIEQHQAAFDYDWRTRFHLPASVIGNSMGWDEAARLCVILRADPSSMLAASLEGWDHPVSREAIIAMDHYDAFARVNSKKPPKSHWLRPGSGKPRRERHGDRAGRTNAEVLALLRPAG